MTRVLLLESADPEERRAALLEDGSLTLLWVERDDDRALVGNVYLGRVVRVEPAIGAAFVDLGLDRPGFLPADDAFVRTDDAARDEPGDEPGEEPGAAAQPFRAPPRIEDLVRTGDSVLVQVARDAVGRKGPTLTTHVAYAGRTLVLISDLARIAVSRRITDPAERTRIEERIRAVGLPDGVGAVARTAAAQATDAELSDEAARLLATRTRVAAAAAEARAPALLHEEDDFVARAVRELSERAPEGAAGPLRIVVDDPVSADRVRELVARMEPVPEIALHGTGAPLFHSFGIAREVRGLDDARVPLAGGASIVIHQTEAMWTIDVNSGRLRSGDSIEETALATDLLAAKEIARQIRLRDLSGLIVIDFIDCRDPVNRTRVEETLRAELAKDPARLRAAPLSEFMVAEITRRRLRHGAARSGNRPCPSCGGRGTIHTAHAAGLAALREIRAVLAGGGRGDVEVLAAPDVAADLDRRRPALAALESAHGVRISVAATSGTEGDRFDVRRRG